MNFSIPVYWLGDLIARHIIFGHNSNNQVGNALQAIINAGKIIHSGPHFKTVIGPRNMTTPDLVLTNVSTTHTFIPDP